MPKEYKVLPEEVAKRLTTRIEKGVQNGTLTLSDLLLLEKFVERLEFYTKSFHGT